MNTEKPRLGFLGFGEAGYHFAKGLKQAGLDHMVAYNNGSRNRPPYRPEFRKTAEEIGVRLVGTLRELAEGSDIVLSVVIPRAALPVAKEIAPFLRSPMIYADLNSCAPRDKEQAAAAVTARGARYVDTALLGGPLAEGLKALLLASGEGAQELQEALGRYGMNIQVMEGGVGKPATVKLVSDILLKGSQSLVFQAVYACYKAGIDPGLLFRGMERHMLRHLSSPKGTLAYADNAVGRLGIHAERRINEMQAVAEMVKNLGIDPIVEEALWKHNAWVASFRLKEHFRGEIPSSYLSILEAADQALGATKPQA